AFGGWRAARRRRSTSALESSRARNCLANGIRADRGAFGPDRTARRVGAEARLRGSGEVARSFARGESLAVELPSLRHGRTACARFGRDGVQSAAAGAR